MAVIAATLGLGAGAAVVNASLRLVFATTNGASLRDEALVLGFVPTAVVLSPLLS